MTDKATLRQLIEELPEADSADAALLLAALQQGKARQTLTVLAGDSPLYETDFYRWTQTQTAALRDKRLTWLTAWGLDLDHLAEEIESLGNEQEHAVRSHLRTLLGHLLKCTYQPPPRRSWRRSILNARDEIAARLEKSPSLRPTVPALLAWAYPRARRLAAVETGLPLATFPEACPWSLEQVLDDDFLPEAVEA